MPTYDPSKPNEIIAWAAGFDERWPERPQVVSHIISHLAALPFSPLSVLPNFCAKKSGF